MDTVNPDITHIWMGAGWLTIYIGENNTLATSINLSKSQHKTNIVVFYYIFAYSLSYNAIDFNLRADR